MAWKARLRSAITQQNDRVYAEFDYYDDQILDGEGLPLVQSTHAFSFAPSWSNADMQAAVQARGKAFREAKLRADVLATAFPPATTVINIP